MLALVLVAVSLGLSNFAAAIGIGLGHAAHWTGAVLLIATGAWALGQAIRGVI